MIQKGEENATFCKKKDKAHKSASQPSQTLRGSQTVLAFSETDFFWWQAYKTKTGQRNMKTSWHPDKLQHICKSQLLGKEKPTHISFP